MATKSLRRMNRFELLELMYELVLENEKLRRKCERLEGRGNSEDREDKEYSPPARGKPQTDRPRPDEDEHYRTRREEVMQRMMEQTYNPGATPPPRPSPAKKVPVEKKSAPAAKPVAQQKPQPERAAVQQQTLKPPVVKARPQTSKPAEPARIQPQQQPRAKPAAATDLDIDSILNEYLSDLASGRNGGNP